MFNQDTVQIGKYSFNLGHMIGKGATGNVYQGIRNEDGYKVAIKVINLSENQNEITKSLLQTQKKALKLMKPNPNVIRLLDIIQNGSFCYIVTEIYNGGTLKDCLTIKGKLNEDQAIRIFRQILAGYCSISDSSIVHRDLKPANIMLKESSLQPIIIDFGFCEIIQIQKVMRAFNVGSPSYMSPQAYTKTLYSQKSDIWSLGVIFYEMMTGKTLDEGIEIKSFFESAICETFITQKLNQFMGVSKQILEQVLRINPQDRISCHKIKYILDKNAIFNMNNPKKSTYSPVQISNSLNPAVFKEQRHFLDKSNCFQQRKDKNKSIYQSATFGMSNSGIMQNSNHSSNANLFRNECNLKAKLAESRYRENLSSPSHKINTKLIPEQSSNFKKINQIQFRNPFISQMHQSISYQPKVIGNQQIPWIENNRKIDNLRSSCTIQPLLSKENSRVQVQPLAFRQKDHLNRVIVPSQEQNFKKVVYTLRSNNETAFKPWGKQNSIQSPANPQIQDHYKTVKPISSNLQKFSFKKISEINQDTTYQNQNQYIQPQSQQPNFPTFQRQNTELRTFTNQNVTYINPNRQYNHFGHQSQKFLMNRDPVMIPSLNHIADNGRMQTSQHMFMNNQQGNYSLNQRLI